MPSLPLVALVAAAFLTPPPDIGPAAGPDAGSHGPAADTTRVVYHLHPAGNEARYRVREQLLGLSFRNDAVGATDRISGQLVLLEDGSVDARNSRFVIEVASLRSDEDRRDNFLRRNTLQTERFPHVILEPRSLRGLSNPLSDSGEITLTLLADLTIRDVTQATTWDVTVRLSNGEVMGRASTTFTFDDFELEKPQVRSVLSVEDQIRLEYDFRLVEAGLTEG